jgi:hypothetical protein
MKRYFKTQSESDLGLGTMYLEFEGEWATRQVECYGDRWFHSDPGAPRAYHDGVGPALVDQPLGELGLGEDAEISAAEFEAVWVKATNDAG